jgi:CheY-like chemotaxis protein
VLVVDDDRDSADSLGILLARRGFEVERAYDATRALEIAADFRPEAILTDVELADERDGLALARALRKGPGPAPAPVLIAISGHGQDALGPDAGLFDRFAQQAGRCRRPAAVAAPQGLRTTARSRASLDPRTRPFRSARLERSGERTPGPPNRTSNRRRPKSRHAPARSAQSVATVGIFVLLCLYTAYVARSLLLPIVHRRAREPRPAADRRGPWGACFIPPALGAALVVGALIGAGDLRRQDARRARREMGRARAGQRSERSSGSSASSASPSNA